MKNFSSMKSPVWNPVLKKDIAEIESVQRKITNCIEGLAGLSYAARLQHLSIPHFGVAPIIL